MVPVIVGLCSLLLGLLIGYLWGYIEGWDKGYGKIRNEYFEVMRRVK